MCQRKSVGRRFHRLLAQPNVPVDALLFAMPPRFHRVKYAHKIKHHLLRHYQYLTHVYQVRCQAIGGFYGTYGRAKPGGNTG